MSAFTKRFKLIPTRSKNADAESLRGNIKMAFEAYHDPNNKVPKTTIKALNELQNYLTKVPANSTRFGLVLEGRELNLAGLRIVEVAVQDATFLRSLCFSNCNFSPAHCEVIGSMLRSAAFGKGLEELDLSGNLFGDSGVSHILSALSETPALINLKLAAVGMTDKCIPSLTSTFLSSKTFPKTVDLSMNTFTSAGIASIIEVIARNINIVSCNITDSGASPAQLTELNAILAKNAAISSVVEDMLANACRRTFKSRLSAFRQSVKDSRSGDDSDDSLDKPVYKWLHKSTIVPILNTPSIRFIAGCASDIGRRNEMQDVTLVKGNSNGRDFFAVFDGHGGREPASFSANRIFNLISEQLEKNNEDPVAIIKSAFQQCNKEMAAWSTISGTTAAIMMISGNDRYIANVGDTRLILCQNGEVVFKTRDHTPQDVLEHKRIIDLGGNIVDGRINGQLAVTRALGDSKLSPYVTAEPEVYRQLISEDDDFAILATDGVWDVVSMEDAVKLVHNVKEELSLDPLNQEKNIADVASQHLVDLALERNSQDNISVVVVYFRKTKRRHRRATRVASHSEAVVPEVIAALSIEGGTVSESISNHDLFYVASDTEVDPRSNDSEDDDTPVQQSKKERYRSKSVRHRKKKYSADEIKGRKE